MKLTIERVYLEPRQFIETYEQFKRELTHKKEHYSLMVSKRGVNNSFFVTNTRQKFINKNATKLRLNPYRRKRDLWLAGEFSRDWLRELYPPFQASKHYKRYETPAPNVYTGKFTKRDLIYFDLVGAYHQMYSKLWLDFTEMKAKSTMPLKPVAIALADWKSARNMVIGNLASDQSMVVKGNTSFTVGNLSKNRHYNPMLLYFINTILHQLASVALRNGCCYIATDGYIFPANSNWREFFNFLDDYGFDFRCISGQGSIIKFAAYNIAGTALRGDKNDVATRTFDRLRRYIDNPIEQQERKVKIMLAAWNRQLNNVQQFSSFDELEFWSKL